ncbi:uncharacterized protein LOC129769248 [Toxorhynchites rutilus septentrionalis]|uniref:uncharacterized protein LOC129769248 n=1 Tax=Toxorhynchites rutilus septentrionalis TaxID=329112 RepID=UPI0024791D72|nr:uncharacterized protein LOC129769248 [Toxorhynchites rutilus septentrionalis]
MQNLGIMWHLKYLTIEVIFFCLAKQSVAQFKILGITSGRTNNDSREVTLIQINPLHENTSDMVKHRSQGYVPVQNDNSTSKPKPITETTIIVENQPSKIIKLQIINDTVASNTSTREAKLQYDKRRTDNSIINITPLKITSSSANRLTSYHRRRATSSIKLAGDSELFYIHKPSTSAPFRKHDLPKTNDIAADFVNQRYKRRKFKSRCRCERIWNCSRIQMSVGRCAPDYFMCC